MRFTQLARRSFSIVRSSPEHAIYRSPEHATTYPNEPEERCTASPFFEFAIPAEAQIRKSGFLKTEIQTSPGEPRTYLILSDTPTGVPVDWSFFTGPGGLVDRQDERI